MRFGGSGEPVTQLIDYLRQKELLLVLDNMEHLVDAALLLSDILADAPGVQMLVTSRVPLLLQEEWRFGVQGLAIPDATNDAPLSALRVNSSVALFVQAAQRTIHTFDITEENRQAITMICRYVHGLPLALELAAAALAEMSCQELAHELVNRNIEGVAEVTTDSLTETGLDLLQTSLRNVPVRHRNIRNLFLYSWQLLSPQEQQAAMQFAIFRGSCERTAARVVTEQRTAILTALVNKSLIERDGDGRYTMHELLRQFCLEQLANHSDVGLATTTRQRHASHYLNVVSGAEDAIKGGEPHLTLTALRRDLDNIRQAWQWALQTGDWLLLMASLSGLARFYLLAALWSEGSHTIKEAVATLRLALETDTASSAPPQLLYQLLTTQALFCNVLADYDETLTAVQEVLACAPMTDSHNEAESYEGVSHSSRIGKKNSLMPPVQHKKSGTHPSYDSANTSIGASIRAAAELRWGEALWYQGEIDSAMPSLAASVGVDQADGRFEEDRYSGDQGRCTLCLGVDSNSQRGL